MKAAVQSGCQIMLVRMWDEDGNAEQEIKRVVGSRARLCPLCNPRAASVLTVYKSVLVCLRTADQIRQVVQSVQQVALKR